MEATKRDWLDVYSDEYRQRGLYIVAARYTRENGTIHVDFAAGFTMSFTKERVQILRDATEDQIAGIISNEWAIEFPALDDGVSLAMLLSGKFGSDRWDQECMHQAGFHPKVDSPSELASIAA